MAENDERQLRVLAVLHYIYGGLVALSALYLLIVLALGAETVRRLTPAASDGVGGLPQEAGLGFVIASVVAVLLVGLLAVATIVAGKRLDRHSHRVYCVIVAAINALSVPLGTVLGIVTIVTLMRHSVIELFEPASSDRP